MLYGKSSGIVTPFWNSIFQVNEAALPLTNSFDALRGHIRNALTKALGVTDTWDSQGPWVVDVFRKFVVYSMGGETFKRGYTSSTPAAGADPEITFTGEPIKVHVAYMDSKAQTQESFRLFFDVPATFEENRTVFESLFGGNEAEKRNDYAFGADKHVKEGVTLEIDAKESKNSSNVSNIPVKLIAPGWGSFAYYTKDVLKEAATNKVFAKGTHMYWNHATSTEEPERPEGDLNNLAAVLTTDAKWDDNGAKGPGLYASAKIFSDYSQQVTEKGAT